jgi:CSLREA domain-containing protein
VQGVTKGTAASLALLTAILAASVFVGAGGAASTAACDIDPQLNHVTIGQGLPYTRLVRGKETLVRFYLSLPSSIPRCGNSSRSIKITSATLTVRNGQTVLNATPIPAQAEAINAEIANTAPTTKNPSIPVNSPADSKFAVPGSVIAAGTTGAPYVASFAATIRYQSKGNDGVFTADQTATFTSYTPPGGTSTAISRQVETRTKAPRILVVPMGGALDQPANGAVGTGMSHLSRLFPVADGTNGTSTALRTAELTSTAGVLRYTVNSGVASLTGLTDTDGRFCGTSTNFAQIQTQLQSFRNAWNGVVNGVDSPQEQDADKVVGAIPELRSVSSTEGSTRGCLEGFAMTNSNESWIRAVANMAGPLFAMEVCHTFGCVADTGTFHSLYTNADTPDPDRAYNVLDRNYISTDRTAMRLITPWTHENTVMEKDHFAYLLCGFGGVNTNGCPAAPGSGTLTGVAATSGSAIAMYGTVNKNTNVANVNSMESTGAPLTVPDDSSEWRLVQKNTAGTVVGPSNGYGIPVRFNVSHHGAGGDDHGEDPLGSFNVAFPAEPTATTIELRRTGVSTALYTRSENNAPIISDVSTGGDDVVRLAFASLDRRQAPATADQSGERSRYATKRQPRRAKIGKTVLSPSGPARPEFSGLGTFWAISLLSQSGTTERVSISSAGVESNGFSNDAAVSGDGSVVAFHSDASNLVAGDTNGRFDIFVRDRPGTTTTRASVTQDGGESGLTSASPAVSGDGRYVAFVAAGPLIPTDTNNLADIYVRDRTSGSIERVSVSNSGTQATGLSAEKPSISDDGSKVAFASAATNLVAGDTNGQVDVFVRDRTAGTTRRVSVATGGTQATGSSGFPALSGDGRFVAYQSSADNLVALDTNGRDDIFVHSIADNATERVSVSTLGTQASSQSQGAAMNEDGSVVVFATASALVSEDTNEQNDIYLRNRSTSTTERVSVGAGGAQANSGSTGASVSGSGNLVAFDSVATNLVADDGNGRQDIFVRDRSASTTTLASVSSSGVQGDGNSHKATISADGSAVVFSSAATNLVAGDTNSQGDIFVRALGGEPPPPPPPPGDTPTFTVNSANDADDGACTLLHCSLREAINAANTVPTAQTISFAIGTGTQTITPTSALPTVTDPVTIDGTTQPGFTGTPIIQLVGNLAPAGTSGLRIATGSTTVRGLVIRRFDQHGILITGASSTNNVIAGNYIGTDISGLEDSGNAREGIRVESPSATIGGTSGRNVVSGNNGHGILLYGSTNSEVVGNYVGTNASGTAAIANGIDGIAVDGGSNNTIRANVASGNTNQGIAIFGVDFGSTSGNTVLGNSVGMDADVEEAVPNGGDGIRVHNGSNTTIGGTGTGAANVIAHNAANGIAIFTDTDIDTPNSKTATGNTVSANSIHTNGALGIDLRRDGPTPNDIAVGGEGTHDSDQGTNDLQNFPNIRSVVGGTISGDLDSTPSTETTPQDFTIGFYASAACDSSGFGEGTRFLGTRTVRASSSGRARFTFTPEPPGVTAGEWVTATATDQDGNTSEFSACRQAIAGEPALEGTTPVTVSGTDEHPQNTRTFVFANCGGRQEPILVDSPPSETAGNNYWVYFNFDPKPTCAGPNGQLVLTVVSTDGFATSATPHKTVTVSSPNERPSPSIATGGPFVQWDGITLHGYAFDDDEQLQAGNLVWTSDLFPGEQKTGFAVPLTPSPSWTPGSHQVTLTATDSAGASASVTKTITILGDADHDGWIDDNDPNDNDRYDAYKDCDNDGIFNSEEVPGRECIADTSFTGTATFQPDPLVLPYNGVVTMTMRLLNKNVADAQASSVRLKSIDGENVSTDDRFKATSVAVTNTGVLRATFSGQNLSNWLSARSVTYNRRILVTMGGVSKTTPQWSFEGTGSTFVRRG